MIKAVQNFSDYLKYGRIVHQSPNGNVIRKRAEKALFNNFSPDIETTKTILNKDGQVVKTLNRKVFNGKDISFQLCNVDCYNDLGTRVVGQSRSKEYEISKGGKKIIDYSKAPCDYKMQKLPNGKTEYEIMYPEITIIKDGKVETTQKVKKVVE